MLKKFCLMVTGLALVVGLGISENGVAYAGDGKVQGAANWDFGSVSGTIEGYASYGVSGFFEVTAYWTNPYVKVSTRKGSVDKAEVAMQMGLGHLTASAGGSASGISASVSFGGRTCTDSFSSATGKNTVSGSYSGKACWTKSYLMVWIGEYIMTGKLRSGGKWTAKVKQLK